MKRLLAILSAVVIGLGPAVGQAAVVWLCNTPASCADLCQNFCVTGPYAKVVIGTTGNDTNLQGGPGNDCIVGNGGNDKISGNQGNDCIITGDGNDMVYGGSGDDILIDFGGSNPRLSGEAGNDFIISGATCFFGFTNISSYDQCGGDDTIAGGSGDDYIIDIGGNNGITGEAGSDTIFVVNDQNSSQHSLVIGGSGDDYIQTYGGNHTIRGEGDNDYLTAADNVSSLDGGSGTDQCFGGGSQANCNP
jgi:Ca2+-binding RTX toxin-like protein